MVDSWPENEGPYCHQTGSAGSFGSSHGLNIDDCRAAYACELYRRLSGHHAPILGGKAPNDEDLEARNHVAYELGNLRIWETDAYVGARANLRKEAAATSC